MCRHVGINVFLLDPEGAAKSVGPELSARDEASDLFFAKVEMPGGLLDGVEGGLGELVGVRWGGVFRHRVASRSVGRPDFFSTLWLLLLFDEGAAFEAMTSRAA